MILHPAIVALVIVSFLMTAMSLSGAFFGIRIIRRWDLASGSEEQLALERRTYLISTILSYVFVFEIGSLFLFIYTADSLHTLFVGAMCAAGALYVDPYGYPTFLLKILNVILAGLWLIVNYVDNRAYDYPLIRKKYALLLILAPLILAEVGRSDALFHSDESGCDHLLLRKPLQLRGERRQFGHSGRAGEGCDGRLLSRFCADLFVGCRLLVQGKTGGAFLFRKRPLFPGRLRLVHLVHLALFL